MVLEQLVVNGVIAGSTYALLAIGLTLIYGILKLINFAHGEVAMVGAYTAFVTTMLFGQSIVVGFLGAIIIGVLLGFFIDKIAFKPLRKSHILLPLITAIAISILLQNVVALWFGSDVKTIYTGPIQKGFDFFGAIITLVQAIIVLTAFALMIVFWFFVKHTTLGKAIRATADNRELAESIGIDSNKVIASTFMIGSALASAGGVLIALDTNLEPTMGILPTIKAFTAVIVGGIGSVSGAVLGAMLIGLAENIGIWFLPSGYKHAIAFAILILFLLFKPSGIFGKKREEEIKR